MTFFRLNTLISAQMSVERLPLVTVEKANVAALKTQCREPGAGMLTPAITVTYRSHRVTPCSMALMRHASLECSLWICCIADIRPL